MQSDLETVTLGDVTFRRVMWLKPGACSFNLLQKTTYPDIYKLIACENDDYMWLIDYIIQFWLCYIVSIFDLLNHFGPQSWDQKFERDQGNAFEKSNWSNQSTVGGRLNSWSGFKLCFLAVMGLWRFTMSSVGCQKMGIEWFIGA